MSGAVDREFYCSSNTLYFNAYYGVYLRVVAPDERVQRYERALVMTLTSMRNVFQHMSTDYFFEKRKVWEDLLSDKKFWKLAKHQNPAVCPVTLFVWYLSFPSFICIGSSSCLQCGYCSLSQRHNFYPVSWQAILLSGPGLAGRE